MRDFNEKMRMERCPLCEKNCPEHTPRCPRGREFFVKKGPKPDFGGRTPFGKGPRGFEDRGSGFKNAGGKDRPGCGKNGSECTGPFGGPDRRPFGGPQKGPFGGKGFEGQEKFGKPEGFRGFGEGRGPEGDRGPGFPPFGRDGGPGFPGGFGREWRGPIAEPDNLEGLLYAAARRARFAGMKRRFGSTQDRIVRILDENGGTIGQKALQELLHVRPGSISEILAKMEEKGIITRSKDSEDRRASLITLAVDAKEAAGQSASFAALTEEEQETLRTLLKKLLDSWKPEKPEE